MPECALSGELNLYKYNPKTIMLEKVSEVGHLPLSDATIVTFKNGEKYIFSTEFPNPNGNVLQIYPFDGNAMTIQPKPVAEISFPVILLVMPVTRFILVMICIGQRRIVTSAMVTALIFRR